MVLIANVSDNSRQSTLQSRRKKSFVAACFFINVIKIINPQSICTIKRFIELHSLPFFDSVVSAKNPGTDFWGQVVPDGIAPGRMV